MTGDQYRNTCQLNTILSVQVSRCVNSENFYLSLSHVKFGRFLLVCFFTWIKPKNFQSQDGHIWPLSRLHLGTNGALEIHYIHTVKAGSRIGATKPFSCKLKLKFLQKEGNSQATPPALTLQRVCNLSFDISGRQTSGSSTKCMIAGFGSTPRQK